VTNKNEKTSETQPTRIYKPEIRKKIRNKRRQLKTESIKAASEQVAAQMISLTAFIQSRKIAFYLPEENELDPLPTIHCIAKQAQDKMFYLPTITANSKLLSFYPYPLGGPLTKNRYGILEPNTENNTPIDSTLLDTILVPVVGFDKHCNRLGRGAGYYDQTFQFKLLMTKKTPCLIGLGYEFQKIPPMIPAKWDVPLDYIVTEETIYRRTR